jgi:hypothetical protein
MSDSATIKTLRKAIKSSDNIIELSERKISLLKDYKLGLIQKLESIEGKTKFSVDRRGN